MIADRGNGRSRNQNPIFTTETHHGGLSARRRGVTEKIGGNKKSKQNQNQNPRTAEKSEKDQGRMEGAPNLFL